MSSKRSETSSGRRRSQEGQMNSRSSYGSKPREINSRSLRSHNLRPQDIEMSQALKEQLGIADANGAPTYGGSAGNSDDAEENPGFLSALKKSFTSLAMSEPTSPKAASPDP